MSDRTGPLSTLHIPGETYSGGANITSFLFICGLHRSGTTLVERYVHSLFESAVLRAQVPENEGQHLQYVYPAANLHGGPGRFARAPAMSLAPPSEHEAADYKARLLACWRPYVVGPESILCEKSPPNLTKIPWLRVVFPGARFLVVVRDPRAVTGAESQRRDISLDDLMDHWRIAHDVAIESLADDCSVVRYEDFCTDPKATLIESGLPDFVPLRPTPLPIDARFKDVRNSNDEYISLHNGKTYGDGPWSRFSYDI